MTRCTRCGGKKHCTKFKNCASCRRYHRIKYHAVSADLEPEVKAIVQELHAKIGRLETVVMRVSADMRRVYKRAYMAGASAAKKRYAEPEAARTDVESMAQMSHLYPRE